VTRFWLPIATASAVVLSIGLLVSRAQNVNVEVNLRAPSIGHLSLVSGSSPYPSGCEGQQTGTDYLNAAVEPSVAVDPTNRRHLIGVWQQNRWSNGAADGLLTAVSTDEGVTWTNTFAPFSQCTGGTFARASDPWVTISPDGTAYQIAVVSDASVVPQGILVSRSSDGGFSWSFPVTVVQENMGDDKETITADPNDANYVYAVWDRTNLADEVPAIFSKTSDGGAAWSPPQTMYYAAGGSAGSNQIIVLPDGTLVDVFTLYPGTGSTSFIAVLRSSNHGDTWSGPTIVSADDSIGVVDATTQAGVRTGDGIPSSAVDPGSGAIYITWEDARFSGGQREGAALSKSVDGGLTWSTPVQVNQIPAVQAFNPTVAVDARGAIAITYYDFRQATGDASMLLTNYWQIVSSDGGETWRETPVAGPFDMLRAALSVRAYFLGDYQALVASENNFIPFFVATNSAPSFIPSSVFALPTARRGSTAWNGHAEINHHPRPSSVRLGSKANRKQSMSLIK